MNPLANRHHPAADIGHLAPSGSLTEVPPLTEEVAGPDESISLYQGDLFLPGWLKTELQPNADQGPGG